MFKKIFSLWPFFAILFFSYFAVHPLFVSGFFPVHDDTQVARVFEMGKSLYDGMFPVRWVSDLGFGYGYPIFNFYGPFAYYIGGLLHIFGLSALVATKIMMIVGILLAAISMYLLVSSITNKEGGIISSLFYLYAPYHALDIYVRGDVGEFYAYAFIPLVFYALWKSFQTQKWGYVVLGACAYAGLITSHNLTAMMVTPFILLGVLLLFMASSNRIKKIILPKISLFLGLLLSSFYFIPALVEMKYTNVLSQLGGAANPLNHFVCLSQFWYSPWGFGGSAPGCNDGISFMLGEVTIVFLFLTILSLPVVFFKRKAMFFVLSLLLLLSLFSLFLTTEYSSFIWKSISYMSFFQYPWRFLLLFSFFSSIALGIFYSLSQNTIIRLGIVIVMAVLLYYFNAKLFVPQYTFPVQSDFYTSQEQLTFTTSKISYEYMPKSFSIPQNKFQIASSVMSTQEDAKIVIGKNSTQEKQLRITSRNSQTGTWNIAYFPAWQFFQDGQQMPFEIKNNGVEINIPAGTHTFEAKYVTTSIEIFANMLSVTGIICLFVGIIIEHLLRQKTHEKTNR